MGICLLIFFAGKLRLDLDWEISIGDLGKFHETLVAVAYDGTLCLAERKGNFFVILNKHGKLKQRVEGAIASASSILSIGKIEALPDGRGFGILDLRTNIISLWDLHGEKLGSLEAPPFFNTFVVYKNGSIIFDRRTELNHRSQIGLYFHEINHEMEPHLLWSQDPELFKYTGRALPSSADPWKIVYLTSLAQKSFVARNLDDSLSVYSIPEGKLLFTLSPNLNWEKGKTEFKETLTSNGASHSTKIRIEQRVAALRFDDSGQLWAFGHSAKTNRIRPFAFYGSDGTILATGRIQALPNGLNHQSLYFIEVNMQGRRVLNKVDFENSK